MATHLKRQISIYLFFFLFLRLKTMLESSLAPIVHASGADIDRKRRYDCNYIGCQLHRSLLPTVTNSFDYPPLNTHRVVCPSENKETKCTNKKTSIFYSAHIKADRRRFFSTRAIDYAHLVICFCSNAHTPALSSAFFACPDSPVTVTVVEGEIGSTGVIDSQG